MSRRRRGRSRREPKLWQKKAKDLSTILVVGIFCYAFYGDTLPVFLWPLMAIAVMGLWWFLLIPTYCDSVLRTDPTRLCTRRVRGKLRGCEDHARNKRDAAFALLSMRNPGMIFRVGWAGPSALPVDTVAQARAASNATREAWMLVLTAISAFAGVLGAAFTAVF